MYVDMYMKHRTSCCFGFVLQPVYAMNARQRAFLSYCSSLYYYLAFHEMILITLEMVKMQQYMMYM